MRTALILVIDDDEDVRVTLGQDLLDAGHLPLFATDAEVAVERARVERPDLVILDVRFPGGGGLDVLQRLKHLPETADIPVVVFSGQKSETIVDEALRLGARAYVQKSYTNARLADAIEVALSSHRGPSPAATLELAPTPLGRISAAA